MQRNEDKVKMEAYKLIAKLLQGFTRNTSTHNFYSTTDREDC